MKARPRDLYRSRSTSKDLSVLQGSATLSLRQPPRPATPPREAGPKERLHAPTRLPKEALGGGTAQPRNFCRTPGGKGCRLAGSLQVVLRASALASHAQRSHGFGQEEVSAVPSGRLREVQEHQPGCHDQVPVRFSSRGEVALEACPGM